MLSEVLLSSVLLVHKSQHIVRHRTHFKVSLQEQPPSSLSCGYMLCAQASLSQPHLIFVAKPALRLSFGSVRCALVACRQWTVEQIEHAKKGSVAVLYASAYGNTAGMAQAISRGITKAGIGVETLNLEVDSIDDALDAVKRAKGFIIGSPTLGGHLPTQVGS